MITWKLDLEQAEFYVRLLKSYQAEQKALGYDTDLGVADDIRYLRAEIEAERWFEDDEL